MSFPLEDYALLGDTETAALVRRDGTLDWACLPRFDSDACFAALLGTPDHGEWALAPADADVRTTRAYRENSMVLETTHTSEGGTVRVLDAMVVEGKHTRILRRVEGVRGAVPMRTRIRIRFEFGKIVPWVWQVDGGIIAVAGPDGLVLRTPIALVGEDCTHTGEFTVRAGDAVDFDLAYFPSHLDAPPPIDVGRLLASTDRWWKSWSERAVYDGPHRELVHRSLITLKALTYAKTGAIVAAPTLGLPEQLGGVRNWDYRYCWIRDSTFTLIALLNGGFEEEARAFREWLLRAIAGSVDQLQIMYGLRGERRLSEWEADWLPGYARSRPVRIGNGAAKQFQLDVYGEALDMTWQGRRSGIPRNDQAWAMMIEVLASLEERWSKPDQGLWESRGDPKHYVESKVMAWVAFDRALRIVEEFGVDGPVAKWRGLRDLIHADVCAKGWDPKRQTFTQSYGSKELDAATLLIPLVGFLPGDDPRVRGTIAAIERELTVDGFVYRYLQSGSKTDGFPAGEGTFLACTAWLADAYLVSGERDKALATLDRLRGVCNDVGLLSEEYDVNRKRLVGNFPQAFSHVGLVNTIFNLHHDDKPAEQRSQGESQTLV